MANIVAMVMAGGAGERLQPLTSKRAKPAVPFGGTFRIVDFTLSNCINSGIRKIFVLTQYKSMSLYRHIHEGWNITGSGLGDHIYCVPPQHKLGLEWYRGTADAIRHNLDLIDDRDVDHVLILSADHIYKMNYLQMLHYHWMKKADVTVAAVRVRKEEASGRLGVIQTDKRSRMIGFEEKPLEPKTIDDHSDEVYASMGIYIFRVGMLKKFLRVRKHDFGKDIIPGMIGKRVKVYVYDFSTRNKIEDYVTEIKDGMRSRIVESRTNDSAYWKDVGTIDTYYEANMDLLSPTPSLSLYGEKWPLRTYPRSLPASKCVLGGSVNESIISDGCIISGGVVHRSILSPGVMVEQDARVDDSIIFDNVIVGPRAKIKRAIVDKRVRIYADVTIGYDIEEDIIRGCTVSENGIIVIPKDMEIRQ